MLDRIKRKLVTFITGYYLLILLRHKLTNKKKIKKIQNRKIKRLMKHAYNIPFYKEKFDKAGMKPEDFCCAEDLAQFPKLTKDELRQWVQDMVNKNPKKYKDWYKVTTSGSSGTPLETYVSPRENAILAANWIRILMNNGYNPLNHKVLALKKPELIKERKGKDSFVQKFGIARRKCIPHTIDGYEILNEVNTYKPDLLHIHRSKCIQMLMYAEKNNIEVYTPKLVVIIGEGIDKNSKPLIMKYFGKVLFSSYGTMETGACTFTRKGDIEKHIITLDTHVINIITDETESKDTGKMLITNLFLYGFPIINYDIGDRASIKIDDNIPYLFNIKGRINDMLKFRNGYTVDYHAFYIIMERMIEVLQFRIVQEDYEHIKILLVMNKKLNKLSEADIENKILSQITNLIPVEGIIYKFEWCDELKPDPNGKRRFIISKVKE